MPPDLDPDQHLHRVESLDWALRQLLIKYNASIDYAVVTVDGVKYEFSLDKP